MYYNVLCYEKKTMYSSILLNIMYSSIMSNIMYSSTMLNIMYSSTMLNIMYSSTMLNIMYSSTMLNIMYSGRIIINIVEISQNTNLDTFIKLTFYLEFQRNISRKRFLLQFHRRQQLDLQLSHLK